jgi:hypothetical protein
MALTLIGTPLVLTTDDTALCEYDITSGIDGTYDSYEFHFVNMHPANNASEFHFQVNASNDTGGGFDTSLITSTAFDAWHFETEDGSDDYAFGYQAAHDLEQEALFQNLAYNIGNLDDECVSGVLTLYAPSSTTYVKHFTSVTNSTHQADIAVNLFTAGYINTALAIPEIRFKFDTGNIDAGTIKMFGVS